MQIDDTLIFGIPLKPARSSNDWGQVQRNLGDTLASIRNSASLAWRIVVAGHDRPADLGDDVVFLPADFPPPSSPNGGPRDKFRKRRLIGAWVREACAARARIMFLDADDWVHRNLVGHVLAGPADMNWVLDQGYRYDISNATLERVERRFWNSCGSSFIGSFAKTDLPTRWDDEQNRYAGYTNHRGLIELTREAGFPVSSIRFPAAVYVVNHPDSLEMQKHGLKSWNQGVGISGDEAHSILREDFGMTIEEPAAASPPAAPPPAAPAVPETAALAEALPAAIASYFGRRKGVHDLAKLAEFAAAIDSVRYWQEEAPALVFHRTPANFRRDAIRKAPPKGLAIDLSEDEEARGDIAAAAPKRPLDAIAPEALAGFLAGRKEAVAFLHFAAIDGERIAAALEAIGDRFAPGAVLVFDRFWNFAGWRAGALRAVNAFAQAQGRTIELLGSPGADTAASLLLR